jgi:hypothetical protein
MAQHMQFNKHNRAHELSQGQKNHMIILTDGENTLVKFNIPLQ